MSFEYDPRKSELNKAKHGIDFEEAKAIWRDANAIQLDTRSEDETRFLAVGEIAGTLWTAVITYRDERIRIISVRRSREREAQSYGENLKNNSERT
jgi:uncharacterized DUF497 family protein